MVRTTRARLVAVLFLFGLEEAVLSQRGHCAEKQCFALFQESKDSSGALKRCQGRGGELSMSSLDRDLAGVLKGLSGRLWVGNPSGTTGKVCSSISVTMGGNLTLLTTPCSEKLDGFLCQYQLKDPCSPLQAAAGAQMKYFADFEVYDSEAFPEGTIAVVKHVGAEYPDSKHLCFGKNWLKAPWNCEVLVGGCEHGCNHTSNTCFCPAKQTPHPNNITCSKDACADCAQGCQLEGDSYRCTCREGYRLAPDKKSCLDVNECEERKEVCKGEGKKCKNTLGGYVCECREELLLEDGVCVNNSICFHCEHMMCKKVKGVYECECKSGYRVSPKDPIKCEKHCTERDCLATCIPNPDVKKKDMEQCFCPDGYIKDVRNDTTFCTDIDECENMKPCDDHKCVNEFGGYRCLCNKGYYLKDKHTCLRSKEGDGLGSVASYPTQASLPLSEVPSYIKAGSALGITVFLGLCVALLYVLALNISKRCSTFDLSPFKNPDIDIFHLQHVTTDTYKRFSFDKQSKSDSQNH
ncbi:Thrombomodulin [Channa argus]|uniref:Thrombomodulin n=1 Tax=Channa argus TaxID=215402 RepID=A0A6G1QJ55_CHAAH|nr:Thrombomodulin [Channa argus]